MAQLLDLVRGAVAWSEPTSLLHARALLCLGAVATWRGAEDAVAEGIENLVAALALLEALGAEAAVAKACRFLGMGMVRQGRRAEARALWERARLIHASHGDAEGMAMMLNNLAVTAPAFDARTALLRESIALAAGADELFPETTASSNLGQDLFARHGATREVFELIARAVDLLERIGYHHVAQRKRILLAHVHAAGGQLVEAQATLDTVFRRGERLGERPGEDERLRDLAAAQSVSAWVAFLRDDLETADSASRSALAQVDGHLSTFGAVLARTVAGRLALARGVHDAAERQLAVARAALGHSVRTAALANDDEIMDASAWARLLAAEVDLALAGARLDDARRAAAEGLAIAMRSENEPAGTVALVSASSLLTARGDVDSARALVAYVRRHRATPFEAIHSVERLEAAGVPQTEDALGRPLRSVEVSSDITDVLQTALRLLR